MDTFSFVCVNSRIRETCPRCLQLFIALQPKSHTEKEIEVYVGKWSIGKSDALLGELFAVLLISESSLMDLLTP